MHAAPPPPGNPARRTAERLSYVLMAVLLLAAGWLHMATLLLSALFSYFAMRQLSFKKSKALGLVLFLLLVACIAYGVYRFGKQVWETLPQMAETTIPAVVGFAEKQGIELPFTDLQSLRQAAMDKVTQSLANVPKYANAALFQLVYLIIGMVVAVSFFMHARLRFDDDPTVPPESLYARTTLELTWRFQTFYRSFSRVMGAQILISLINTALTAGFLFFTEFPYAPVLTAATFLCGLLPIIGNIISNTLITAVGLTISPLSALVALGFLVAIHKLEYFLNSKIVGDAIKNPMWLTLIGLLLGEKLMGIPGMILAPVVLHYIKVEASRATVGTAEPETAPGPAGAG